MMINRETEITYVKGVGPVRAKALGSVGIHVLDDLIRYYPRRYLDRSTVTRIRDLRVGEEQTVIGRVEAMDMVRARRRRYFQIVVGDESGFLRCVWFNGLEYVKNRFRIGESVAFHGKVELYNTIQIVHPDFDKLTEDESSGLHTGRIIPLYSSTAALKRVKLDSRGFRRLIMPLMDRLEALYTEYFPENVLRQYRLMNISRSLRAVHFPDSIDDLRAARYRLKFEELFFLQLMLLSRNMKTKRAEKAFRYKSPGPLLKALYEKLPFALTDAQKRVVKEIWAEMRSSSYMNRLLQGDVGSGKTVVALLVASIAIGNGYQAALMAPTEILAEQHYRTVRKFCETVNIRAALLIGGQSGTVRSGILSRIQSGEVHLVVGTHALIQEKVAFSKLSLVIIDEQHRFGVMQRGELIEKGFNPDVLVMTATPIPRTLSMTLYGDMDVSILDEMPARKASIETRIIRKTDLPRIYRYILEEIKKGYQAYVVYPLIEESEKIDLKAAQEGYEYLRKTVFRDVSVGLMHGRLKTEVKDRIMNAFIDGTIEILVSTTVIEVGIDNPRATIMVVENAERFGLTQLHQLRGRIGRGSKNSVCFLVQHKSTEVADERLKIISSTTNGFDISEQDLKLRGPGEFFGTRQHGWLRLKIADLSKDSAIVIKARNAARSILESDIDLDKKEHTTLKQHFITHYKELSVMAEVL